MPDTLVSIRPSPIHAVRWAAVLAGMAVGLSFHLVLTLTGTALGFALSPAAAPAVPLAAGIWHGATMVIAACVGGYIAARTSGLRRLADGVLHGAVSWGATTVLFVVLTLSAIGGAVFGGLFGLLAPPAPTPIETPADADVVDSASPFAQAVLDALRAGDREEALRRLQEEAQMSPEQARRYVELATPLVQRPPAVAPAPAARVGAVTSGWLAGAIVLSLFAGVLGGGVGARGARRFLGAAETRDLKRTRPGAEETLP